jgi:hypothetical protein
MTLNFLDRIGDWNPQLFREIKGRLTIRNVAITIASSLLGQILLFLYWVNQQPSKYYGRSEPYCIASLREPFLAAQNLNDQYRQLQSEFARYSSPKHYDPEKVQQLKVSIEEVKEKIQHLKLVLKEHLCPPNAIDYQLWWQDHYPRIFISLSVFALFIVLVMGTYMLISNLANEERRGTLNFLRLTPQSTGNILIGKLLGVPILLYIAAIITVPLHLWLGFAAQIPLAEILTFYLVLIASCAFFFSAALLFGLVTPWLGGFQAWLGGGAALMFLMFANFKPIENNLLDWLNLFSPSVVLPYLVDRTGSRYTGFLFSHEMIQNWKWFNLPIGGAGISLIVFVLLHYSLWTGWIWQALNRQFHNPTSTIFSKRQSYWLVACFEVVALGFIPGESHAYYGNSLYSFADIALLGLFNFVLFLGLIALLSPHRQTLQDWARYRREKASTRKGFWNRALVQELIGGEKSPALVAIAINLAIAVTPFLIWIAFLPSDYIDKPKDLLAIVFFVSLMMIYASIAQLMLFMKTNKRSVWAAGTIAALIVIPPLSLSILNVDTVENSTLWLFSTFPWGGMEQAAVTTIGMVLLVQWGVLVLLNFQLTRQLRRAGESESKALFAGRPVSS